MLKDGDNCIDLKSNSDGWLGIGYHYCLPFPPRHPGVNHVYYLQYVLADGLAEGLHHPKALSLGHMLGTETLRFTPWVRLEGRYRPGAPMSSARSEVVFFGNLWIYTPALSKPFLLPGSCRLNGHRLSSHRHAPIIHHSIYPLKSCVPVSCVLNLP